MYNFDPYSQQFISYPMQQQYNPQPMQQPRQAEITVAQVPTIEQVEQVQLMPGDKKIILVQNAPVIAIRIADQMGLVSTEYRRTEVFDPHAQAAQQPAVEYAPMSAVQQLQDEIIKLSQELDGMKGENNRGKPAKRTDANGDASN